MAIHKLSNNFAAFFKRLNPSPSYVEIAARTQKEIRRLIENREGPAGDLKVKTFIQGSYGRDTAIHTINDVDIVALANLSKSSSANRRTRDQLFDMLGDSIKQSDRYAGKVKYDSDSICVKVMLSSIKIEVLPALKVQGTSYYDEPFWMFGQIKRDVATEMTWVPAFARKHQKCMSDRNSLVNGKLIPMVKVLKHLRSQDEILEESDAPSFLIECLLYALKANIYSASFADCIEGVLTAVKGFDPEKTYGSGLGTPCRDKKLFETEWGVTNYEKFHKRIVYWQSVAAKANVSSKKNEAIDLWKLLLGTTFFPRQVE